MDQTKTHSFALTETFKKTHKKRIKTLHQCMSLGEPHTHIWAYMSLGKTTHPGSLTEYSMDTFSILWRENFQGLRCVTDTLYTSCETTCETTAKGTGLAETLKLKTQNKTQNLKLETLKFKTQNSKWNSKLWNSKLETLKLKTRKSKLKMKLKPWNSETQNSKLKVKLKTWNSNSKWNSKL